MGQTVYVCDTCGAPAHVWGRGNALDPEVYYKHSVGGRGPRTCGQPAVPILRSVYDLRQRLGIEVGSVLETEDGERLTVTRWDSRVVFARGEPWPEGTACAGEAGTLYWLSWESIQRTEEGGG
jgi:hypothetical protein